jgi:hypothetical protein
LGFVIFLAALAVALAIASVVFLVLIRRGRSASVVESN